MSDWSEDYGNTDLSGSQAGTQGGGEWDYQSFLAGIDASLTPAEQSAASQMGLQELQSLFGANGSIDGVANSASMVKGEKESSAISKWWKELSSDDKKIGLSVAALLAGGLSNIGKGKRMDRQLNIEEMNAQTNAAAVAERARQFNIQQANGSAIGQTNFGTAMGPAPGIIGTPAPLLRNRLMPTSGVTG